MKLTFEAESARSLMTTDESLAEVIREELFAAGTLSRTQLQQRVRTRTEISNERIRSVIERLSAIGDLTEGDAGIVAAAPVRLIDRGIFRGYWLGTSPSRWLARNAGAVCLEEGWPRGVKVDDETRTTVTQLGGVVLGVAEWAGLAEVLPATSWVADLKSRVALAPWVNGALVPAACSPSHYLPSSGWSEGTPLGDTPTLIRWTEFGYMRWGFASGQQLIDLRTDDARRTMLALQAEAGAPAGFRRHTGAETVEISTESWLPAAEWRLLVGLASHVERKGRKVVAELPVQVAEQLVSALQRAGLREEVER